MKTWNQTSKQEAIHKFINYESEFTTHLLPVLNNFGIHFKQKSYFKNKKYLGENVQQAKKEAELSCATVLINDIKSFLKL